MLKKIADKKNQNSIKKKYCNVKAFYLQCSKVETLQYFAVMSNIHMYKNS